MNYSWNAVLFVAAAALFSANAQAQSDGEKKCAGTAAQGITPDMVVEACSSVIAGAENPAGLASAYYNRGNAYYDKKDFPKAIADYTRALSLRPNYPTAMFNRGLAKKRSGDSAGGDADIAASKTMRL